MIGKLPLYKKGAGDIVLQQSKFNLKEISFDQA